MLGKAPAVAVVERQRDPFTFAERRRHRIGEATAPVLIASGTSDTRTTLAEAQALFARAPNPKQLWAVPGAGHVDLEAYAPDEYRRRVLGFLESELRRQ